MGKIKIKKENGYAILELLFYISIFVVLALVVIDSMIIMSRAFKETSIQAEFLQGGAIMERMSREVRQAYGVSAISSTDLSLNTTDSAGVNKVVRFALSGTNIQLWDAGINIGNMNPPNISVTSLSFTQITTAEGQAIKIVMTIQSSRDTSNRSVEFYDTLVLRGDY
jgi:type II secretory pathway pseudopilin PulG